MNIRNLALAGALVALATPFSALAASQGNLNTVLGDLNSGDRAQVRNVISLLQNKQIDANTAASQVDAVLSNREAKAVLADAKKAGSTQTDAGVYIISLTGASF